MTPNEIVLAALLVVVVLVIVYVSRRKSCSPHKSSSFQGGEPNISMDSEQVMSPYTAIEMQDNAIRGSRNDAFDQANAYKYANLAKNYRNWAASPRDLEEAQRAAWFEAVSEGANAYYNPEKGGSPSSELVQHHTPGPSINYQDTLVDLIADPRMRAQQSNWASEVSPKSQTSMKVDTINEAATMSAVPRSGIYAFRFSAPSQHNPVFITDQDAESYGVQTTEFRFGG